MSELKVGAAKWEFDMTQRECGDREGMTCNSCFQLAVCVCSPHRVCACVCEPGQTLWLTRGSHHCGRNCLLSTRLHWFHWGKMKREYPLDLTPHVILWLHILIDSWLCVLVLSWIAVSRLFGIFLLVSSGRLPPTYTFHFLDDVKDEREDRLGIPTEQTAPSQSHPFPSRLVSNRRVTDTSHFQDVRHIEFDITGSNIEWVMWNHFRHAILTMVYHVSLSTTQIWSEQERQLCVLYWDHCDKCINSNEMNVVCLVGIDPSLAVCCCCVGLLQVTLSWCFLVTHQRTYNSSVRCWG